MSSTINLANSSIQNKNKKINKKRKTATKLLSKYKKYKRLAKSKKIANIPELHSADIGKFLEVREELFGQLQNMVRLNCEKSRDIALSAENVEKFSLAMEQKALLTCMQTHIYKVTMDLLLEEMRKATEENTLHSRLKKHLESVLSINSSDVSNIAPQASHSSVIPHQKLPINNLETEQSLDLLPTPPEEVCLSTNYPQSEVPQLKSELVTTVPDPFEFENPCQINQSNLIVVKSEQNFVRENVEPTVCVASADSTYQGNVSEDEGREDLITNFHEMDHEAQIENLMHILQGSDEEEEEQRLDLDSRINQLQDKVLNVVELPKRNASQRSARSERKLWNIERYIFMYKIIAGMATMTAKQFCRTRDFILDLFGDDSDEEHEEEFMDFDEYVANCVRRILPSVARYLMPYYSQRRVTGGTPVFKNLVRRIASCLVEDDDYPSDELVRSYIVKFFPENKKYSNINEVWSFVPPK